jgi:hypothetical protein
MTRGAGEASLTRQGARKRIHLAAVFAAVITISAAAGDGLGNISKNDLHEWLSYIASDELEGRAIYSSGLGLAAGYIQNHLQAWGAEPAGDGRTSYLQTVSIVSVKATRHSTLTVSVGGQTRTFADGDGVTFPSDAGGIEQVTLDRVEFAGYGLDAPGTGHMDFAAEDVRGAAVIWLGRRGPQGLDSQAARVFLAERATFATEQLHAAAGVGPDVDAAPAPGTGRAGGGRGAGRGQIPAADFVTTERLDTPRPPNVTGSDAFFEFLFSRAPVKYDELKRRADAREPLPSFRLDGVTLTFHVDNEYQIVRTQYAQNVVAVVEGSDPALRNTYVAFGAHYDHLGYAQGELTTSGGSPQRLGVPPYAFVKPGAENDRIWNGADDDGSGTVALMALAKAFAEGPRPKRSLLFVWHTGEESGRLGSLYFADHPTVPIANIVAQLNIDMIGRNRDDKASESRTVYLVGSDRISSELDAVSRAANDALAQPLKLDYELNDPADPEQLYFRSDHYSYAAKGIPVIFFTTGLHPDYHRNTDEVSRIEFDKLTRVTGLVYETGWRVANLDHAPLRDNKGARAK